MGTFRPFFSRWSYGLYGGLGFLFPAKPSRQCKTVHFSPLSFNARFNTQSLLKAKRPLPIRQESFRLLEQQKAENGRFSALAKRYKWALCCCFSPLLLFADFQNGEKLLRAEQIPVWFSVFSPLDGFRNSNLNVLVVCLHSENSANSQRGRVKFVVTSKNDVQNRQKSKHLLF